jgi:lipopolysaccharide/colanic/teichoic acid biosynthesis glycosyltransferase
MKRSLDIFFSLIGLLILLPLLPFIAILIKRDSRGPVFFLQERIGKDFKRFKICKFRTMESDADKKGARITAVGDDRVTKIGRTLRKFKIDELPQLFNVLKGDMSLVGPRPEVAEYVQLFEKEYRKLLSIRPGITDPASLHYSNEAGVLGNSGASEDIYITKLLPEKIRLSSQYVDNHALWTDLKLIVMTLIKTTHIRPDTTEEHSTMEKLS